MTRTESYRVLKMIGAGLVSAIIYLSDHNIRQVGGGLPTIVPDTWMLALKTLAAGFVTVGAYLAVPPTGVRTIETPAVVVNHMSAPTATTTVSDVPPES